jgi:RNA polymerase sigma-70 factor (ECF subfamily)
MKPQDIAARLEQYRNELTAYCRQMLGSTWDAEDAVQETLTRAWQSIDRFEHRSSLRTWIYQIATNACIDILNRRQRYPLSVDFTSHTVDWPEAGDVTRRDPAEVVVDRESVQSGLRTAFRHLPARQRAVLLLREVLCWRADETAELLDTTVASVNSALQRARAKIAGGGFAEEDAPQCIDGTHEKLLVRHVDALAHDDVDSLVALAQASS